MQEEHSPAEHPDTPQDINAAAAAAAAQAIADASAAEGSPASLVADLQARLAAAEQQGREHQENFLRAKAETDNVRKRASQDLAQARKYAVESFAAELIPVRDSLEAALGVQTTDVDSYRNGVELTLRQLGGVLEKFSIVEINPVGEKFDPHRHQAIAAVESEEPANTVLSVMQKGYALHDRVLRPAFVTVAKPREGAA